MTVVQDPPRHPLLRFADALDVALDRAHQAEPVFLSPADRRGLLLALDRAETRLHALRLRVLAAAAHDDAGEAGAFRYTADYIASRTCADLGQVKAQERLALALEDRWQAVGAALRAGRLSTAQARVISDGLDRLPHEVAAEVVRKAEAALVEFAGKHPPTELRRLARRILDVVAPEIAEEHEARALEAEERRAHEATSLHVVRNAGGMPGLSKAIWKAPDAAVHRLLGYLDAFTSPRHRPVSTTEDVPAGATVPGSPASGERLPAYRERGLAMLSLLEHLDPERLPLHGGTATTLVVTIDHEVLLGKLGTAGLLTGDRLSVAEARRLACSAGILPAVLDGEGKVLDLGRTKRLFSKAQITAMRLRDKRCRAEGCQQPAERCEAHHKRPWSADGPTDLENGVLVCSFHHHRIDDERYLHEYLPNGDIRFTRRT